jgi:hypothetical protein
MKSILLFVVFIGFFSCSTSSEETSISSEIIDEDIVKINDLVVEDELQHSLNQDLDEVKLRSAIWNELNDFKNHKVFMQTKKFKVLIDQLEDGSYRYASWPKSKTISDEPDLILKGGTVDYQGSGGNHMYVFANGDYTYKCYMNVLGKTHDDAFLTVIQNEKVIVDHEATFISPFSKVIGDSVMPFVLKNYQPGNYFYNQYDFVKLLYRSAVGGDMHPEGSSLNPSLEDRLRIISGMDLILGHDKDYITYYNPAFFKWLVLNLTPEPNLNIGNYTVGGYYHEKFAPFARKLMFIYWNLEKKGFEEEAMKYKEAYTVNDDVLYHLANEYGTRVPDEKWVDGMPDKYFDINAELSGFLLRRYIHDTHDDVYDVLEFVLEKYDSYWLKNALVLNEYNLKVESQEIQEDAIRFIENGFQLVDCKSLGNSEYEAEQTGDHLFTENEFQFDECDGAKTYEIFSFHAGDHVSKHIPTLADNDWKAVEHGSSLKVVNPMPNGEFSWNSNLTMAKDSNGVLSSIYFDNRGMGGGYEISISRKGNICKLKYYGFAD